MPPIRCLYLYPVLLARHISSKRGLWRCRFCFIIASLVSLGTGCSDKQALNPSLSAVGTPPIPTESAPNTYTATPPQQIAASTQAVDSASSIGLSRFTYSERIMATDFKLILYAAKPETADQAAKAAIQRMQALNAIFSDYDDDAELFKLSKQAGAGPIAVSPELIQLLQTCSVLHEQSQGAFDPTLGPLSVLWRQAQWAKALPSPEQIESRLSVVGMQRLEFDLAKQTVTLPLKRMRLDLGGIAKGAAADEGLRILAQHGITSALIDAGGDLAMAAPPPGETGWRVGIEDAAISTRRFSHCGVASSGASQRFVDANGLRYSHILDPRTGLGVTHGWQVTVIASNGTLADGWASALSVLGKEQGMIAAKAAKVESIWTQAAYTSDKTLTTQGSSDE